jgi:S-adenosylmethionine synthetase
MSKDKIIRTAESVSPKHPDKLCDRISDAILDAFLAKDPSSRVAVDTVGGHGKVFVTGEVTSNGKVEIKDVVNTVLGDHRNEIEINLIQQSPEIGRGVDSGGAGDQGIMVGYACRENRELVPLEYYLARKLNRLLYRHFPYDGKTQFTIKNNGTLRIVASFQNSKSSELGELIDEFLGEEKLKNQFNEFIIHTNPAGDWTIGGFDADSGLTGRKIIVDNYGPRVPVGGGAFSGKDPSKVDRSAAYMARRVAVDYLKNNPKVEEALVYLAYAIGEAEPLQATVNGKVIKGYDLTPNGIIDFLDLKKPIYSRTAEWGHFGNGFNWN